MQHHLRYLLLLLLFQRTFSQDYEFVANTQCQAADGSHFDLWYKTTTFTSSLCQKWCTDAGSDCVAYGMGKRSDLVAGCMIYMKDGKDPTSKSPRSGILSVLAGTAVNQNVVSKTSDSNWRCYKKMPSCTVADSTATNTINCLNGGIASGVPGSCTCTCINGYTGTTCGTAGACLIGSTSATNTINCQNGGTASGTSGNCQCSCLSGFSGAACETVESTNIRCSVAGGKCTCGLRACDPGNYGTIVAADDSPTPLPPIISSGVVIPQTAWSGAPPVWLDRSAYPVTHFDTFTPSNGWTFWMKAPRKFCN